ncbi:MAG: 23S rRNA (pseudouridine(1915)-N(3))-methyltransferase RlmH [Thermodesulfobacteriota bacterium]|nr:23S rRNA (pseudouridine(1915)-N(3))-methyltransferase RlmH [Candidatus Desulfofervidus sp.]MDL1966501.1 23S rRNA (pseudouridine(1915)-N(3))-methyltransferase RlmH [Candidatus Desulfofervidus auxilii]RKX63886.1 MAG: 23S rRNA (pseudouridine(1915)-N(3))-methyltransferase RlmH [Thermodesulfobacteriota bacterium]
MKFKFIWIGRTKSAYLSQGINDYVNRLKHYAQIEIKEIKPKNKSSEISTLKERETQLLEKNLITGEYHIALDEKGKLFSTEALAKFLAELPKRGHKTITFFIGGPFGLEPKFLRKTDLVLSLSPLTFTHEMARIILLEQLYRVLTIWQGEKYHK